MGGEWRQFKIGDLFDLKPGFAFKSSDFTDSGVPVIKIKNVKANVVVFDELSYVDEEFLKKKKDYIVNYGDILITMSGNRFDGSKETWVGKVAQFRAHEPYLLNQRVAILRPKQGAILDQRCCSYILGSSEYQDFFIAIATSSGGQANLSPSQILGADVLLPPYEEQRAIAHILGTLDDKIELNRRMNQTLEEMARALFKSWFVDFDPVRAKAAVRREHPDWSNAQVSRTACPTLKPEIAELFPDEFENSELGEIPKGWRIGCVDDVFDLVLGQSPPGETYNEVGEGIPFYQGRADFTFRFPDRRVYCTAPTRFAKKGDTLISVRAPVGAINLAFEDCAIGRGVAAARHKTGAKSYTYYFMHGLAEVFNRFEAEGTVFGSISKKDFHAIQCVIVPSQVVEAFERLCEPIDVRVEFAEIESRSLAALRDTLLPKLISGEIRVKDAEKFLKERGL
ncbi:MAG TPA: restriction endonuclease subunit S [Bacteroidales bacterium]|nr:restriction endonuclease subunit S [Bacteroidales bacterium]